MTQAHPPFPRADLPTPALVVDLPALEHNIAAMAHWAAAHGIALRPHAKTHKSADIARRQLAAGAAGICCAKLGEAEALAAAGVRDILITSPVVPAQALARLARLAPQLDRLAVVADHPGNVDSIAAALAAAGARLDLLVDVDTGAHRTGVTSPEAAAALAARIAAHPNLRLRGVQFYCGTLQHVASAAKRRAALAASAATLRAVLAALHAAGLPAETVTGGGTGSFAIDAEIGLLTELQPGSYVFMDREYRDCEAVGPAFEPALFIDTRIVSANTPGRVTVDAGLKAMATEAGPPVVARGAHPESAYRFMGDEHGMLLTPPGAADPALDTCIALVPPHCDPTVNLYDLYAVCEEGTVVAWWPVTARGRSS
ncbi:MAG TPA: alanine racemase [Allosphingosinicella sp.]|jgi:D-serine deaminase-like pyridoxal phosphate-dependent protein